MRNGFLSNKYQRIIESIAEAMLEIEDGAFSVSNAKIPEFINNYLSSMAKGVGGSTVHNTGLCYRTPKEILEFWEREWKGKRSLWEIL